MGSVPEQVRRNAERATQILNDINKVSAESRPEATDQKPGDEAKEAAQPEQTPTQVEQSAAPVAPEQPPADASPAPAPTKHEPTPEEKSEQRYRSLQGVMAAEQRRWSQERATLEERIRALEAAKPAPAPTPAPQPAEATKSLVTDADVETYGPELLDVIGRKATEMANRIVKERLDTLAPQLEKTRTQVENVTSQVYRNDQDRFTGELTKLVPDWRTVNADEKWLQWLGEVDPLSGLTRQAYLDNAAQHLDFERTAVLFNTFKRTTGKSEASPSAPATPAAQPTGKPAISPSPRTVGTSVEPAHREPDTSVSSDEITAHYKRSSMDPAYRNSPEHAAVEKRIATAMAAGKVTR